MTTKGTVTIDSNPNNSSVIFALLARYDSVYNLKQAAYRVRQLGYTEIDAYSPFPVHGMEKYLGLKKITVGVDCLSTWMYRIFWCNYYDVFYLLHRLSTFIFWKTFF